MSGVAAGRDAARFAEEAASRLPPLLVAADRVATAVAAGVHGRRRSGQGDSFWEYRPLRHGEAANRIDWRRSARGSLHFVRETEWEAAQTVCLWCDPSPRMGWRSDPALPRKAERGALLALALASLLLRGGERPRPLGPTGLGPPVAGSDALARLAATLLAGGGGADADNGDAAGSGDGLPALSVPPHASVVLVSDFLAPLDATERLLASLASRPARGVALQVLDPAEAALPFRGRLRFRGLAGEGEMIAPRAETLRDAYAARLAAHQDGLRRLCTEAGFATVRHDTNDAPEQAVLALHRALAG